MEFKVCILAAGIGTRMAPLTDKINKSLLPVDFKAAISHIIEKFNYDIEIIIAVGHLKETILNYLECSHANRNFTIVEVDNFSGEGSGPGYSLMQCKEHLDKPFIFFASDTLVLEDIPAPSENWLGVSEVSETINYCTAEIYKNKIVNLEDKTENQNKNAFIGLAGVNDYEIFFDSLENNNEIKAGEYQVSNGFSSLINHNLSPKYFTWFDTGNMDGYLKANKQISKSESEFDFSKNEEFLYFVNNMVIKYFASETITKNRCTRALMLENLCPNICSITRNFYSYDMVKGKVIYDVIDEKIMDSLLSWLDDNLWINLKLNNDQSANFKIACHNFYFNKSIDRINKYHAKYSFKDTNSSINDIEVPSTKEMFSKINWDDLCQGIPSNFHGDLQFDNILLTEEDDFLLLDWRQDFSGSTEYGDRYYDFAKLNGGMKVSYKLIKQGHFSYSINSKGFIEIQHDIPEKLNNARKKYIEFLEIKGIDINKVNLLTSLIYLNMSPMHNEPFDHFIYNFGKLNLYRSLHKIGHI